MPSTPDNKPSRVDPAGRCGKAIAFFIGATVLLLTLDLTSKHLAFQYVAERPVENLRESAGSSEAHEQFWSRYPHQPTTVIPKVLSLKLLTNRGAVFGIGQGQWGFFVLASVLAVGVLGYIFWTSPRKAWVMHLCLAMILAGALGNLYDRVRYEAVRDMLYLFPGVKLPFGWHWPGGADELYPWIFNVADVCLVVGIMVMAVLIFLSDRRRRSEQSAQG